MYKELLWYLITMKLVYNHLIFIFLTINYLQLSIYTIEIYQVLQQELVKYN
jgi:hypothetical protein